MNGSKAGKRSLSRRHRNNEVPIAFLAKALRLPRTHPVVNYAWELDRYDLRWDEAPITGVYAILDSRDGDIYFGQTNNVYKRKSSHDSQLRRGTHRNYVLQDACPGGIDNRRWRFLVLEDTIQSQRHRLERECWWQNHVPSCINVLNDLRIAELV